MDASIPPESMDTIFREISSVDKSKLWVENSGHVIIREPEREMIFTEVRSFLQRLHA
jgi:esterase/lipase